MPNILKKRDDGDQIGTTRTWSMYPLYTSLHLYHSTTPTYTMTEIFKLHYLLFVLKKVKNTKKIIQCICKTNDKLHYMFFFSDYEY